MKRVFAQILLVGFLAIFSTATRAQTLPPGFAGSYLALPILGDPNFISTLRSRDATAKGVVGIRLPIPWDQIQTNSAFDFKELDVALSYIEMSLPGRAVALTFFCGANCNQLDPPTGGWPIIGSSCVVGGRADFRDLNYQAAFRKAEQAVAQHIEDNYPSIWTSLTSVAIDLITDKDDEMGLSLNTCSMMSWQTAGLTVSQVIDAQRNAIEWLLSDWPSTVVPVEVFYPLESDWANLYNANPSVTQQLIGDLIITLGGSRVPGSQVSNMAAPRSTINPPAWLVAAVKSGATGIGQSVSFASPCTDNMTHPLNPPCDRSDVVAMFQEWEGVPVTQFQFGQATIEAAVYGMYPNGTGAPVPLPTQ